MNKKLIKTIASITCGLGIVATIPFVATSCGSSSDFVPENALPYDVYDIRNNILLGFKEGIDLIKYKGIYDTIQIPSKVTSIADSAFCIGASTSTIPSFIKKITFAENSKCSSIGEVSFAFCPADSIRLPDSLKLINEGAFYQCSALNSITFPSSLTTIVSDAFFQCPSLTSITFPSSLTTIGQEAFCLCENLINIKWDLPIDYKTEINIENNAFGGIYTSGKIESLNKKVASSQELLDWIRNISNWFPENWTAAN